MGYRHYFYEVNIADCYIVKPLSYSELEEYCKERWPESYDDDYLSIHVILDQKEIFEFGKLYWDDTAEKIYACGQPLFDIEATQEAFEHYKPYMMGKEALLAQGEHWRCCLEAAPAVDAVEVVRCKGCKHWMYEFDDVGLCVADVPDIEGVERTALSFCSIGERKTE